MGSSQWALPLSGCDRGSTSSLCVPLLPGCWSAVQGTDHLDLCGLTQRIVVLLRQLSSLLSPFQHGPLFEVFKGTRGICLFLSGTLPSFSPVSRLCFAFPLVVPSPWCIFLRARSANSFRWDFSSTCGDRPLPSRPFHCLGGTWFALSCLITGLCISV